MAHILLSALSARRGGGLTYLRHIIGAFPVGQGHTLSILSRTPIENVPTHPDVKWVQAPDWTTRPIPRFLFGSFYFRFAWPRRYDYDLVYFAGGSLDLRLPRKVKIAVAFRNMLPFDPQAAKKFPLGWMRFRHWALKHVQSHAFKKADLIIFISAYARQVIDRLVRRRGDAAVIPHGVTSTNSPLSPALAQRLPPKFVLYLSILDYYKAHVELVEAWAILRKRRAMEEKLVLAGPDNSGYAKIVRDTISRLGLEDDIIILGEVPHDQVFDLADRSAINLFMSPCENCPNIMLELMRVGKPMLISDHQPMPELGGPDLEYVDSHAPNDIANSLAGLLADPDRRDRIAMAALERSQLYSWAKAGRETWDAILACASK